MIPTELLYPLPFFSSDLYCKILYSIITTVLLYSIRNLWNLFSLVISSTYIIALILHLEQQSLKYCRAPYRVWPSQGFTLKHGARWDSHTWRVFPPTSLGRLPGSPSLSSSVTSSKRPPSRPPPHLKEFTSTSEPRPGFTSLKSLTLPVNL